MLPIPFFAVIFLLPEETGEAIADGTVADLLLVAGNPVADIEAAADKANHRAVIKRGSVVAGSLEAQPPRAS